MKKHLLMLAAAATCFVAGQAGAQTAATTTTAATTPLSHDQYNVGKEKVDADYKVAMAQCKTMKDNAKDICEKDAKGKQNVAKAELEQQYQPSDSHARAVEEERVKANYEVAKERCDDQKGDAKSACEKQASADEAKGKADIKAMKKM
jgi:hypothetical protein